MATLAEIRAKHPEYGDLTDQQLADGLYKKFYSDMPRAAFDAKVGLTADGPPGQPGSREYADWAAAQARAGKPLRQVSPTPPGPVAPPVNLYDATMATVNGLTGSVPGLQQASDALLAGGQTVGDMATGQPVDFGARFNAIEGQRKAVVDKAPLANTLGGIGGTMALTGGVGALPGGAAALGLEGGVGKQLVNSALSAGGYEGLQGLAHGHTGGQLLADEGIGAGSGLIGSAIGQGLNKLGQTVADKLTEATQNRLTREAIKNAPVGADLFNTGSKLFDASVDTNPLQVTKDAYGKLLSSVEAATQKIRPNENTSKEGVGLLQKFWTIADELNATPPGGAGVVVDFKDLHILRRTAQDITQSNASNESKSIAGIVVSKIDDFINGLKPGDIAGGVDPAQASSDLMTAISTWHKASKVSMIEDAIKQADTYKTSYETGLKTAFTNLMKTPEYQNDIFTPIEKDAIRQVAKGTSGQNLAELIGRMGFTLKGGVGANMIGGGGSTAALTGVLAPALGPFALPAALATTSTAGKIGREISSHIGSAGASRVAQIMATNSIPIAKQLPNMLASPAVLAALAARAAGPAMMGRP